MSDNLTLQLKTLITEYSLYYENVCDLAMDLIEKGADVNGDLGDSLSTPFLCHLVEYDSFKLIDLFLKKGANPNAKSSKGMSALHYSAFTKKKYSAELLLENGADIFAIDNNEMTPLKYLNTEIDIDIGNQNVANRISELREVFIEEEYRVQDKTIQLNDEIRLSILSEDEIIEAVDALLKEGANINLEDQKYCTSINYAIEKNYYKLVAKLIDSGAEMGITNDPIVCAINRTANPKMVKLLIEKTPKELMTDNYRAGLIEVAKWGNYYDDDHKQSVIKAVKETKYFDPQMVRFKKRKSAIKAQCRNKKIAGGMKI